MRQKAKQDSMNAIIIRTAILLSASPAAFAAARPAEPMAAANLLQMMLGLIVVLAAIGVIAWLLKRLNRLQAPLPGSLRVLGGLSLGTRERAVLLQVGDKQILVGVAPGSVRTLHVLDKPAPEEALPDAPAFAERLAQLLRGRR